MAKRRNFSAAFKAKVALEALRGDQTLAVRGHVNWAGRKVRWILNWPDAPALLQASPLPSRYHPPFGLAVRQVHSELPRC